MDEEVNYFMLFKRVSVDRRLNALLLFGSANNLLFDTAPGNDAINGHRLGLADSVDTVLSLFIHGGVPIIIVEDDRVCSNKVETETTSSG